VRVSKWAWRADRGTVGLLQLFSNIRGRTVPNKHEPKQ
jgi:hypothetical protein